jgi:alcohol dehydrogenase class IV
MTQLPQFQHATPAFRTFCGDNALTALPREMERLGCHRVAVVGGPWLASQPAALDRIKSALGERLVAHFDDVEEHSPVPAVEAAARVLADSEADAVVALGGGSSIVTARAATILLAEGKDVRELCTRRGADGRLVSPRLTAAKIPNWVVPTTPITAYAKAGSAVRDQRTGERLALFDPKTRAQGIFLDPVIALTAPAQLAQGSALDAFSMAVESLQAGIDDPLTDALLLHALRLLTEWLPRLRTAPDDPEPRLRLMLAALLCGQGSDYVGGGLAQALSHAVGPRSSVGNGVAEAILLPHAMRYAAPATKGRLEVVADILDHPAGSSRATDNQAIDAVARFLGEVGVPSRLRDAGVARDDLPEVAAHAMDDWSITRVPRPVTHSAVTDLLEAAW